MPAGPMRHYVDVIGPGEQRDSNNQVVGAEFVKLHAVPCSIETVNGGETRRGQQMQATTNKLVTMHFVDDRIKTGDLLRSKVYPDINVLAAYDPDGRRRETIVQGRSNA